MRAQTVIFLTLSVALLFGLMLVWAVPVSWIHKGVAREFRQPLKSFTDSTGLECHITGPRLGPSLFAEEDPVLQVLCIDAKFAFPDAATERASEDFTRAFQSRLQKNLDTAFATLPKRVHIAFIPDPRQFSGAPVSCYIPGPGSDTGWFSCAEMGMNGCEPQSCRSLSTP